MRGPLLGGALALGLGACAAAPLQLPSWPSEAIPGELVVGLGPSWGGEGRQALWASVGAVALAEAPVPEGWLVRLQVPSGQEAKTQHLLQGQAGLWLVEANWRRRQRAVGRPRPWMPGDGLPGGPRALLALTNDPALQAPGPLPNQGACWGLLAVRAPEAWDRSAGQGVTVAIVDTGVDLAHPDLVANLDLANATNLVEPGRPAQDDFGHGTHVAGIVAAVANNGQGGVGLAHQAKLLPIRVLGVDGTGSSFDSARAIRYAQSKGCKVVNLSLGAPAPSEAEAQAVAAAQAAGLLIVAASGNEAVDGNPPEYPANYPGVVSVGATGPDGQRAPFSNYGQVTLSAPGVDIFSTLPLAFSQRGGGAVAAYGYLSGTSMAAPMVAAGAALTFASHPGWTANQVLLHLRRTARELTPPGDLAGPDMFTGSGQLDAAAAVAN